MKPDFKEISEFVGVVIGDGNIWSKKYEVVISGDTVKDKLYFQFLQKLVFRNFGHLPRVKYRSGALRLVIRSKQIFTFLLAFFTNGKHANNVAIPNNVDPI